MTDLPRNTMNQRAVDMVERLGVIPEAMAQRKQWLLWRFVLKNGQDKPSKMPCYINGCLRGWPKGKPRDGEPTVEQPQVAQGHDLDREHLATLAQATEALHKGRWDGLGFAFLPGDGLIGIDVDGAIDLETGEVAEHCQQIIERCASYTELSPSGKGIHVIVSGTTTTFKDNDVGVEVFCGRQFFTVTARPFGGDAQVQPISSETLDWLRVMVKGEPKAQSSNSAASMDRQRDAAKGASRYCLAALESGVSRMRMAGSGRRNSTLNAEAYGLAQLVHTGGISEIVIRAALSDAARAVGLADAEIDATLASGIRGGLDKPRTLPEREPTHLRAVLASPPAANAPAEPAWVAESSPPPSFVETSRPRARGRGRGGEAGGVDAAQQDDAFWARVNTMGDRFRLIETTDTAWDGQDFSIWRVPNMRMRFGQNVVKGWLGRIADDQAKTVKPVDLVFEPGQQVDDHQINMWAGLKVKPIECDSKEVEPMLALLRHLCSETSSSADDVDVVMHWILRWQALPLQQVGTKMQTACVFHGAQGTGKNLYWDVWRDLFGVHGITVGQTELEDKFNGWVSRKLAIIGDEVVSRQEMYHNKNRLKSIVTQEAKFPIRGMMQETRWESNHANVVFLSNESQPLALEERDRRYLVVFTPLEADPGVYEAVRDFKANGGLGKWMHYLQHYPLDGFDAHTKPIMTRAKEDLIELNWKAPERFVYEWTERYLDLPVRVCSAEQIYRGFRRWCDRQGERWPPSQALFTKAIDRWVKERVKRDSSGTYPEPVLRYKQIALRDEASNRRTVRCWVPAGAHPPPGVTEGEWAFESVQAFEADVGKYCRSPGVLDDAA